jgi:hypothetical protein
MRILVSSLKQNKKIKKTKQKKKIINRGIKKCTQIPYNKVINDIKYICSKHWCNVEYLNLYQLFIACEKGREEGRERE